MATAKKICRPYGIQSAFSNSSGTRSDNRQVLKTDECYEPRISNSSRALLAASSVPIPCPPASAQL